MLVIAEVLYRSWDEILVMLAIALAMLGMASFVAHGLWRKRHTVSFRKQLESQYRAKHKGEKP